MPNPIPPERLQSVVDIMKTIGEASEDNVLAPFKTKARWAARRLGPFFDMRNALVAGLPEEGAEVSAEQKADFQRVMGLHPDFPRLIANFQGESDAYENFITMMVTLMGAARADDTHTCKVNVKDWLPTNPARDTLSTPLVGNRKDNRGFAHKDTARALTPLRLLNQFDANPQLFMARVENGTIAVTAKEYPSFLYPAGTAYNRENPSAGLFRGATFLRALRAVYTGLSSALDGYRVAPKNSQAEINGMTEVFPEAIATVAVHVSICITFLFSKLIMLRKVRFSLSDEGSWAEIDRSPFKYHNFFLKCMRLFADLDDEWVKETLEFLTSQIPSLKRRKRMRPSEEDEEEHDDIEDETTIILARRAALAEAREREARERDENGQDREEEGNAGEERIGDDIGDEDAVQPTPPQSSQAYTRQRTPPRAPSLSSVDTPPPPPRTVNRSSPPTRTTLAPPPQRQAESHAPSGLATFRIINQGPNVAGSSSSRAQPPLAPPALVVPTAPPVSIAADPPAPSSSMSTKARKAPAKKKKPRY
ncbi:hypothetical protein CVT26_012317 [Gymnopilus dilepis]|uniref:Uncharacterized protein n=1 Tax=Gymnopilus dilepis TaxID=231916 RepID=A0A409YCJ8_9AGAR|nr:hypothetical protein CVT26_012317 [Gymnopilus dilepis]